MLVTSMRDGKIVAEGNFLDGPKNVNTSATDAYASHRLANGSTLYFISARTGVSNTRMKTLPLVSAFRHDNGSTKLSFVWTWVGPEDKTIQSITPPVIAAGSINDTGAVVVGITYGKDQVRRLCFYRFRCVSFFPTRGCSSKTHHLANSSALLWSSLFPFLCTKITIHTQNVTPVCKHRSVGRVCRSPI